MHRNTIREVKLSRHIIKSYVEFSDEHKRSLPEYYSTLTTKSLSIDDSGEVKIHVIKDLLRKIGIKAAIYTWIGGKVIIDLTLEPTSVPFTPREYEWEFTGTR